MNDRPHEMGQDHPTPACATGRRRATSLCFARSPSTWSPETGAPKPASVAGARRLPGTTATCSRSSHAKLMREPWDLTRRVTDFEARLNREPFVIADRLWVKNQLDPEEEKLRFSK